jgi:stage II sporulation protein D
VPAGTGTVGRVERSHRTAGVLAALASAAVLVPTIAVAGAAGASGRLGDAGPGGGGTSGARADVVRIPVSTVEPLGPLTTLTSGGPVSGTVTFYGRGYGHGVGLSQYGARGRALAGQTAETILAHYFAKTTRGSVDPQTRVRVLVLSGFGPTSSAPLVLHGRGGTWSVDGVAGTWPAEARLTIAPTTVSGAATWRLTFTSSTGAGLGSATVCCSVRLRPQQSSTRFQVDTKPSMYDTYRGVLRVYGSATKVSVVNEVGLDLYLRGVVPVEMPYTWPTQALRAQSIAARSYAVSHLHPATGSYDVYDDTRSQVYRGTKAEKAATNVIVDGDSGAVLMSGTSVVNAMFHSTAGGATEDNEYAFVSSTGSIVAGPLSYLRGSSDRRPDGTAWDADAPYATWRTATYTVAQLSSYLAKDARTNVGTLSAIDLSHRGVSGRVYRIVLTGSLGSKTVSGDVFRSVFNTWSPAADPGMMSTLLDLRPIP